MNTPSFLPRLLALCLPLCTALAPLSCAAETDQSAVPGTRRPPMNRGVPEGMETLRQAIAREVAVPLADDPSQCGLMPLGARACGGPQSYLVYSRKVSNEARLRELVEQYTRMEQEWNLKSGVRSICMVETMPQIVLADGKCQASRDGGGQGQVR
ncbi:MAG TPA: hypothetical protein VEC06_11720 [Paucimonas sp.]|nr:hypothetical protein [Paucimonas sp.]